MFLSLHRSYSQAHLKPLKETITLNHSDFGTEDSKTIINKPKHYSKSENNNKVTNQQSSNIYSTVMRQHIINECRHNAKKNTEVEDDTIQKEDQHQNQNHNREGKKNYAGYECGAKIFSSSDGIKNPNDLIKKNHDEYMLTECRDNLWIVIELCDNVRIQRIELDNSELYSGGPKDFTISVTDKYSKNQKDWNLVGTFQAKEDKKIVQHFNIIEPELFGKYLLLNFLTNYAHEHYCTLTSFRAFGLTEYEYLSEQEEAQKKELEEGHEPKITHSAESQVHKKLKRIADELKKTKNTTEKLPETTTSFKHWPFLTLFTYQYIMHLNHNNDNICLDSRTLEMGDNMLLNNIVSNKGVIDSVIVLTNNISDTSTETIDIEANNSGKTEQTNSHSPNETVLIQISKRLKILEKNVTLVNRLVKCLNNTNADQSDDILHILEDEEVVKAQDTFQSYIKENEAISTSVKILHEKLSMFESMNNKQSMTIKELAFANLLLLLLVLFFGIME